MPFWTHSGDLVDKSEIHCMCCRTDVETTQGTFCILPQYNLHRTLCLIKLYQVKYWFVQLSRLLFFNYWYGWFNVLVINGRQSFKQINVTDLPLGILYPVSPGFLKFLSTWSEWMLMIIPVTNISAPDGTDKTLYLQFLDPRTVSDLL